MDELFLAFLEKSQANQIAYANALEARGELRKTAQVFRTLIDEDAEVEVNGEPIVVSAWLEEHYPVRTRNRNGGEEADNENVDVIE